VTGGVLTAARASPSADSLTLVIPTHGIPSTPTDEGLAGGGDDAKTGGHGTGLPAACAVQRPKAKPREPSALLSRRQLLAASPTTLPLVLALSACKGPAVLSAPPGESPQTQMLLHAVTAEQGLVWIYDKAVTAHPALAPALAPLRAEHEAHLAQLRAQVIEPPGKQVPDTVTAKPALSATENGVLAQLRATEQAAVKTLMSRLTGASPSLAQLYASIAASEATHVSVLTARISG
jgi:hypothetical protein